MPRATKRNTPTHTPAYAQEPAPLATWRAGFLISLGLTGNVSAAARAVGIERSTAYRAKASDPSFAEEWAAAEVEAIDRLVEEARNLATGQYRSYKFNGKTGAALRFPKGHALEGQPYYEHQYHPGLLQFLLSAHRPEVYGNKLKLDTSKGAPAYDLSNFTAEELALLEQLTLKATPPQLP